MLDSHTMRPVESESGKETQRNFITRYLFGEMFLETCQLHFLKPGATQEHVDWSKPIALSRCIPLVTHENTLLLFLEHRKLFFHDMEEITLEPVRSPIALTRSKLYIFYLYLGIFA